MGLDIIAYRKIVLIESDASWEDLDNYEEAVYTNFPNNFFPNSADDIQANAIYSFEDRFHFRAGSYGGYNRWRKELAISVLGITPEVVWDNPQSFENAPFYRLINFSDCEGCIGTEWCKKLAKDFQDYQASIDALDIDSYDKKLYADWRKAFEFASDNGLVEFC